MLSEARKQEIIDQYGIHEHDTGSVQVQIALLTAQIQNLTDHLEDHPQDNSSRKGMMDMVGKRKRLLSYLQESDVEAYRELVSELGLRK